MMEQRRKRREDGREDMKKWRMASGEERTEAEDKRWNQPDSHWSNRYNDGQMDGRTCIQRQTDRQVETETERERHTDRDRDRERDLAALSLRLFSPTLA